MNRFKNFLKKKLADIRRHRNINKCHNNLIRPKGIYTNSERAQASHSTDFSTTYSEDTFSKTESMTPPPSYEEVIRQKEIGF